MAQPLIPDAFYQKLGKIVSDWSLIEALLSGVLAYLLEGNPRSVLYVSQGVSIGTQIGWIKALARDRMPDPSVVFFAVSEIDDLRAQRNVYVHGIWRPHNTPHAAMVQVIRPEQVTKVKDQLVTLADLDVFLSELADAISNLSRINDAIRSKRKGNSHI